MSVQLSVKIIVIYKDIDFFLSSVHHCGILNAHTHPFFPTGGFCFAPLLCFMASCTLFQELARLFFILRCILVRSLRDLQIHPRARQDNTRMMTRRMKLINWYSGMHWPDMAIPEIVQMGIKLLSLPHSKYSLRPFSCYPPLNYSRNSRYPLPFFLISDTVNKFISRHLHVFNIYIFSRNSRRYIKSSFTGMVDDIIALPIVSPHTFACSQISEL